MKNANRHFRSLIYAILLLLFCIFTGMVWFILVEDYTMGESFYMAMTTISTVGFGEVRPFSSQTQVFIGFYILMNLTAVGYILSVMSKFLFEGELKNIFKNIMSNREMGGLKNHVIVCGCGRNGYRACKEFMKNKVDFIIIDPKPNVIQDRFGEEADAINYIIGDATDEEILEKAGIARAKSIIAAVPKDAINVFIALTARELNKEINIIARATELSAENKLYRAGANYVVMPDNIGGHYMATIVRKPHVIDFLDMLNGVGAQKLSLEEIAYQDLKSKFRGLSIRELNVRKHSSVTFVAYKTKFEYQFNPNSATILNEGEHFIVLGGPEELLTFKQTFTSLS